jgi:aldose 1-epimerase
MLELSAGPISARLVPEAGGIITRLNWRAPDGRLHKILRAPEGAFATTAAPNQFGCWAMLPFANRAFDNVVDDGERRFTVPDNNEDGRGNIHGFGWQAAWDVLEYDRSHTVIEHRRSSGSDPYRYRARQEVRVDFTGMTVALAILNEADSALPFGLGLHPWFNCAADTRLAMKAEGALDFGEGFRATGSRELEDGGPYAGAPVFATGDETAWSLLGWDGTARIETPSTGLAITLGASQSLRSPVVWAPADADFLCVEPQSHAIGSTSVKAARAASPLRLLQPGETLSGWMRISPQKL